MMMGTEWLVWVVVAVVLFRLVTRGGRWRRGWLWYDDWLDDPYERERLPGDGRPGRDGYGRRARAHRLARRRAALEDAADRLEEASTRLRRKARGDGRRPTPDDRRPLTSPSAASGPGRLSGSAVAGGSGSRNGSRVQASSRKPAETRLATLQRRFAEGRITMEQYERELDKLYGLN